MLDDITKIAINLVRNHQFSSPFQPDELVNEAWIASLEINLQLESYIKNRARWDMLDYIKKQIGRNYIIKGEFVPRNKFITNMDYQTECGGRFNIFDQSVEDTKLLELENEELLIKLLLKEPTEQQLRAIFYRYFEERQLKEIGQIMGYEESMICKILKKGVMKCQEKLKEMELVRI